MSTSSFRLPPAVRAGLRRRAGLAVCLGALLIGFGGVQSVAVMADEAAPTESAAANRSSATAAVEEGGDEAVEEAEGSDGHVLPELSVEPLRFPIYPEDRPAWIDEPPRSEEGERLWPVVSVPCLDRERCHESLRTQVEIALGLFAEETFGRGECSFSLPAGWVDEALADRVRRYEGKLETSDGEMFEAAALLRFDDDFRARLHRVWKDQQVAHRLAGLGLLGGGSFVLLLGLSFLLRCAGVRPASQ